MTEPLKLMIAILASPLAAGESKVLTICELFERLGDYNGKPISVRATLYSSPHVFAAGQSGCPTVFKTPGVAWPTAVALETTTDKSIRALVDFETDFSALEAMPLPYRELRQTGRIIEVTATFVGVLQMKDTYAPQDPTLPPKPARDGFGWLGLYPARLIIKTVRDVEVKSIPDK